jgi:hypothetical protein
MKLGELEKALLKILKKCAKLSFREQIAFLLKEAEKAKEPELKVVIYLYVNYLIQQFNVKSRTPFVLPPISEIHSLSSRVTETRQDLDEIIRDIPVDADKPVLPAKSLYSSPVAEISPDEKSLYSSTSEIKKHYHEDYKPAQPLESQEYHEPSGLEKSLDEAPREEKRYETDFDSGYSPKKKSKEQEEEEFYTKYGL